MIRNDLHLSAEQFQALAQWQADMQRNAGRIAEVAKAAQKTYETLLDAETWTIAETPLPEGQTQPEYQEWTIGAPKVNFVDHIDHIEVEDT